MERKDGEPFHDLSVKVPGGFALDVERVASVSVFGRSDRERRIVTVL